MQGRERLQVEVVNMRKKTRTRLPALRLKNRLISVFALISLIPTVSLVILSLFIISQSRDRWEAASAELRNLRVVPMSEKALWIAADAEFIQTLESGNEFLEADFELSEDYAMLIYDADGKLLFSTNNELISGVNLDTLEEAGLPPISEFPLVPVIPEEIEVKKKELALSAVMVQSEEDGAVLGVIVVGKVMPSVAADIGMRTIIAVLTLAGVLIFLIALWISSVIAREITEPVRKLVAGTQEVAAGNLECQVDIDASDEIGMLADSFNVMTRKLRSYSEELRQAEKAAVWREVAQKLAHEIKNPLTPIQLSAERLRRRYRSNREGYDEILDECTQTIMDEVERLRKLLDEFSRLARMPRANPVPSDINSILEKALRLYGEYPKNLEVKIESEEGLPQISVDPEQMERAFFNIIKNAAEAMNDGGTLTVSARAVNEPGNNHVEVVFADTGPGISTDSMDKLFTPHFSTKRGGSGLGLAIVKKIITDHGGDVTVKSNEAKGTAFTVKIPIVEGADDSG